MPPHLARYDDFMVSFPDALLGRFIGSMQFLRDHPVSLQGPNQSFSLQGLRPPARRYPPNPHFPFDRFSLLDMSYDLEYRQFCFRRYQGMTKDHLVELIQRLADRYGRVADQVNPFDNLIIAPGVIRQDVLLNVIDEINSRPLVPLPGQSRRKARVDETDKRPPNPQQIVQIHFSKDPHHPRLGQTLRGKDPWGPRLLLPSYDASASSRSAEYDLFTEMGHQTCWFSVLSDLVRKQ